MGTAAIRRLRPASRFLLQFVELQIPMVLGASVCYLLGRLIADSPDVATVYRPGTYLFALGDVLFLIVPVAAWMLIRGRGWRYSLEMALAMLAPVAGVALVGEIAHYPYLLWLVSGMYPAMSLGMILDLLYRRDGIGRVRASAGALVDRAA